MENIICPLRIGLAPTHDIIELDGSVNEDYQCFGEPCGWFVDDEGFDNRGCALVGMAYSYHED